MSDLEGDYYPFLEAAEEADRQLLRRAVLAAFDFVRKEGVVEFLEEIRCLLQTGSMVFDEDTMQLFMAVSATVEKLEEAVSERGIPVISEIPLLDPIKVEVFSLAEEYSGLAEAMEKMLMSVLNGQTDEKVLNVAPGDLEMEELEGFKWRVEELREVMGKKLTVGVVN